MLRLVGSKIDYLNHIIYISEEDIKFFTLAMSNSLLREIPIGSIQLVEPILLNWITIEDNIKLYVNFVNKKFNVSFISSYINLSYDFNIDFKNLKNYLSSMPNSYEFLSFFGTNRFKVIFNDRR